VARRPRPWCGSPEVARAWADTTDRDRIGRLLRYAWNEDGVLVNEALVEEGLALVVTFPPDTRYVQRYEAAQERARASGAGVWSAAPTPTPAGDGGQVQPLAGGDCDAAYPDFCIPPPSRVGDLDCGDVDGKRFRVLPPDPHGFDRDADGIGCES
jgi:micrococcal nuclease